MKMEATPRIEIARSRPIRGFAPGREGEDALLPGGQQGSAFERLCRIHQRLKQHLAHGWQWYTVDAYDKYGMGEGGGEIWTCFCYPRGVPYSVGRRLTAVS